MYICGHFRDKTESMTPLATSLIMHRFWVLPLSGVACQTMMIKQANIIILRVYPEFSDTHYGLAVLNYIERFGFCLKSCKCAGDMHEKNNAGVPNMLSKIESSAITRELTCVHYVHVTPNFQEKGRQLSFGFSLCHKVRLL